jgi:4'-phosphopantetheinyl transferase EntD
VLAELLASVHGPEVIFATGTPTLVTDKLFPYEQDYVAHAVAKRQAEFGTARVCAREALSRLGVGPCSLVPNTDRSPRWPAGIRGSIAHTDDWCAVAVTGAPAIVGIGLDLEADTAFEPELEGAICTRAELNWIRSFDRAEMGWLGPLVFSAKEAFYKCQYAVTSTRLNFKDVELHFDLAAQTFTIGYLKPKVPQRTPLMRIQGTLRRAEKLVVTTAILTA